MFFGYLVLLLGVLALFNVLGWIAIGFWQIFWPLLIIVVGLKMVIVSRHCRKCADGKCDTSDGMEHGHEHGKEQSAHGGQM
jgi:hypothetical protein